MSQYDLCTLADVKAWLGRSDSNSDALLAALIARTSRQILSYLRRPTVLPHAVNDIRDGTGGVSIFALQLAKAFGAKTLITRVVAKAPATPSAAPISANDIPFLSTSFSTSLIRAPRAIRIPISCVRCATA